MGGWACDGGTIQYGLLFRGGELNGKNYGVKLTDADKDVLCTQLGIRAEIDLRSASEISGVPGSALGSAAAWEHYAVTPYASGVNVDGLGAEYAPVLRSIIRARLRKRAVLHPLYAWRGSDGHGVRHH